MSIYYLWSYMTCQEWRLYFDQFPDSFGFLATVICFYYFAILFLQQIAAIVGWVSSNSLSAQNLSWLLSHYVKRWPPFLLFGSHHSTVLYFSVHLPYWTVITFCLHLPPGYDLEATRAIAVLRKSIQNWDIRQKGEWHIRKGTWDHFHCLLQVQVARPGEDTR